MARQLVWLKWRLLVNGLRTDRQRRWGMPVIIVGLTTIAVVGGLMYHRTARGLSDGAALELGIWLSIIGWIGWATLPVLVFPIDETLDPAKFASLPMAPRRMMTGLIGAAFLTPPIVVPVVIILINLVLWTGWFTTPIAIVAVGLLFTSYIVGGQTFTTAFSMLVKSRRGRDLTMLFVVLLGLGLYYGASSSGRGRWSSRPRRSPRDPSGQWLGVGRSARRSPIGNRRGRSRPLGSVARTPRLVSRRHCRPHLHLAPHAEPPDHPT